ncbi:interleukin-21 receptor [Parambassis ranga]|uniref:Interleukin-21 receptor n=1 Tax=Parambassis ranga TaxID=210632 RepID=A0A6P7I7E5_9TELE|nr:interleukin-21 receptor-like [Parambassis ranga]
MDQYPALKLVLLITFLLKSTNVVWLHGNPITEVDHHLHCVTNYLMTINCSLSITPAENSSYWLTFTTFFSDVYKCVLMRTNKGYFCSVWASDDPDGDHCSETFTDTDSFDISLCHNQNDGSENCQHLDEKYEPSKNITPNPPCCLAVSHSSGQQHFTWNSTYELCRHFSRMPHNLQYQLHFYRRGDEQKAMIKKITTDSKNYSVDDEMFKPNGEYAAKVRSSPNGVSYKGEWSAWSPEIHWRTQPTMSEVRKKPFISELGKKVFIPLIVILLLISLLCYAPIKRWKQSAFIPTPAPYFHTLYTDCQGDFKSWVVTQENTADILKAEETLQIDTLTECAEVQEEDRPPQLHPQLMEGSAYNNVLTPACSTALLGIPYAVSTMVQGGSMKSLSLSCPSLSPTGDSGCWLCSDTSLEKDTPWYCNEYCTLSSFQQAASLQAEQQGKSTTA